MPRITAVICTRDHPDLISRAAGSVLECRHDAFELLVVDQSVDGLTAEALSPWSNDARLNYVHLERAGLSIARNAGLQLARTPLVAFTDDDCVVPQDWLAEIEIAFERHPAADLLYGQTLAAPELWNAGVTPAFHIAREVLVGPRDGFQKPGMGATLALKRAIAEEIGGFDEALGAGGVLRASEDFDFQFRAMRAGASCLYTPRVWVTHYGMRSWSEWPQTQKAYGIGDAAFYLKHVRCGDGRALRLLLTRVARLTVREALNPIRRKPSQWHYLRSYATGIRESMKYAIDREKRLYRLPDQQTS